MIVVDATVAVKLLVREPGADKALTQIQRHTDRVAPTWMRLEVANALVKKVRRNELAREQVAPALCSLSSIVTELVDPLQLIDAARELALDAGHPIYDCLYLALAVERKTSVLTHDRGFAAATERIGLGQRVTLLA